MVESGNDVEKDETFPDGPPVKAGDRTSNLFSTPAGYTYLSQFIDHDLTFDPVSVLQKANDGKAN